MTAQQLRNSILQAAIQGKLVPQNPAEGTGCNRMMNDIEYRKIFKRTNY